MTKKAGKMRRASSLIIALLFLSMFVFAFRVPPARTEQALDTIDWWPTFHHDATRAGYTTSPGPAAGTMLWQFSAGGYIMECGPAIANAKVYSTFANVGTYCIDAVSGASIWHSTVGAPLCSPAVANGRVYVVHILNGGLGTQVVYCLNASTGATLWSYATGGSGTGVTVSCPLVDSGRLFVGASDGKVYCLNASSGSLIWTYATSGGVGSSPAVNNGMLYIGSDDDRIYCLNASSGNPIWNFLTSSSVDASPAVANGMVYVGSGNVFYCLNASSGRSIWTYTGAGGSGTYFRSSPAVAYGKVYVGEGYDSYVYCFAASSGTMLWQKMIGGVVLSSPAVAGGYVYVSETTHYNVYCLSASTGAVVWNYTTHGPDYSSPAVANGMVYVGSNSGKLFCLGQVAYSIMINAFDNTQGAYVNVPITMDGSSTGHNTPYTFSGLTGSHTFAVPSTDSSGHPFLDWSTGQTTTTITVPPADGTYIAYYQAATPALSASASATPMSGNAPLSVQFSGSASGGSSPYSYSWNFGDGGSSNQQNPSHTYQTYGTYTATLTVTDSESNRATASVTITVLQALSASASANPTSGNAPLSVQFTGSASGGTPPYSHSWSFGDGSPISNLQNPSHTYQSAGTYLATLTVTDSASHIATSSVTITVGTPPAYSVTINAFDNTQGVDVSVPITENGLVTGFYTPHTFTGLTGGNSFTVPYTDPSSHPFAYWDSIPNHTATLYVSGAGTHTAYYAELTYTPQNVVATPVNNGINLTWNPPNSPSGYTVQNYYVYRGYTLNFAIKWNLHYAYVGAAPPCHFQDDIQDNNIYYYVVVASFSQGFSAPSSPVVGCARLESLKGVSNVLTGADSLSIPEWFWYVTFQQNFLVFTGNYENNQETVFWCQNTIVKGMNGLSYITYGEIDVWGPVAGMNIGALYNHLYARIFGLPSASFNDLSFVSEISGTSILMQNSLLNTQTINLGLTQYAYIRTISTDYPPSPKIDPLYVSYPPNFVIVGNKGGYNEVFLGGLGRLSSLTKIGKMWINAVNVKTVSTGESTAITFESSEGLKWGTDGRFQHDDDTKTEGIFFVPDFQSQIVQPLSVVSSSNAAKTLVINANCPVYLDLYDNFGNCVGYNATSGVVERQIENAVWVSNNTVLVFDPSGNYTLKVTGTANGTYDLKTSLQDLSGITSVLSDLNCTVTENEMQSYGIGDNADVALMGISPSAAVVDQGFSMQVNVPVADLGGPSASTNVTVYANQTIIGTQSISNLAGWNSTILTFTWNTTGSALGNYTITAYATPALGETVTTNNNYTYGTIMLTNVAIMNATLSAQNLIEGSGLNVSITLANYGSFTEAFSVTIYALRQGWGTFWSACTFPAVALGAGGNITLTADLGFDQGFYDLCVKVSYTPDGIILASGTTNAGTILIAPYARFHPWSWMRPIMI